MASMQSEVLYCTAAAPRRKRVWRRAPPPRAARARNESNARPPLGDALAPAAGGQLAASLRGVEMVWPLRFWLLLSLAPCVRAAAKCCNHYDYHEHGCAGCSNENDWCGASKEHCTAHCNGDFCPTNSGLTCTQTLEKLCSAVKQEGLPCLSCVDQNSPALDVAHCTGAEISDFCTSPSPPPGCFPPYALLHTAAPVPFHLHLPVGRGRGGLAGALARAPAPSSRLSIGVSAAHDLSHIINCGCHARPQQRNVRRWRAQCLSVPPLRTARPCVATVQVQPSGRLWEVHLPDEDHVVRFDVSHSTDVPASRWQHNPHSVPKLHGSGAQAMSVSMCGILALLNFMSRAAFWSTVVSLESSVVCAVSLHVSAPGSDQTHVDECYGTDA